MENSIITRDSLLVKTKRGRKENMFYEDAVAFSAKRDENPIPYNSNFKGKSIQPNVSNCSTTAGAVGRSFVLWLFGRPYFRSFRCSVNNKINEWPFLS